MTDDQGRGEAASAGSADQSVPSARLAEEIRLLVDLVVDHAAPWLEAVLAAGHGGSADARTHPPAPEPPGEDRDTWQGSSCAWCPLCAVVAVLRGERPELAARVVEQAAQLVALLRAVLADRWEPEDGVHMPGFEPRAEPQAEPDGERVQRVPVRPRRNWTDAQEGARR